jgi:hypothetical protein
MQVAVVVEIAPARPFFLPAADAATRAAWGVAPPDGLEGDPTRNAAISWYLEVGS